MPEPVMFAPAPAVAVDVLEPTGENAPTLELGKLVVRRPVDVGLVVTVPVEAVPVVVLAAVVVVPCEAVFATGAVLVPLPVPPELPPLAVLTSSASRQATEPSVRSVNMLHFSSFVMMGLFRSQTVRLDIRSMGLGVDLRQPTSHLFK
jgi:hypothetical protein